MLTRALDWSDTLLVIGAATGRPEKEISGEILRRWRRARLRDLDGVRAQLQREAIEGRWPAK